MSRSAPDPERRPDGYRVDQHARSSGRGSAYQSGRDQWNLIISFGWLAIPSSLIVICLIVYLAVRPAHDSPSTPVAAPPTAGVAAGHPAEPLKITLAYDKDDVDNGRTGCGAPSWNLDKSIDTVAPPTAMTETWARGAGGIDNQGTYFRLTLQSVGPDAVNIQGVRVVEVERVPADTGIAVSPAIPNEGGCGGNTPQQNFAIDLGRTPPTVNFDNGMAIAFTVTNSELEQFNVSAVIPDGHDCQCLIKWKLAVNWSSMGNSGVEYVTDGDQPFETNNPPRQQGWYYVKDGAWIHS
jgi:hypothetical protein